MNKLKDLTHEKTTTYAQRKKLGINLTENLLVDGSCETDSASGYSYKTWIDMFNDNKKKDDLADSFLQAISFSKKHNLTIQ